MGIDLLPAAVRRWLFEENIFTAGMVTFFFETAYTLIFENTGSRFGVIFYGLIGLRCAVSELLFS
jgi:hypothetical protein